MSIRMTQGLMFETDDLNLFETMLESAVRVLFTFRSYNPRVIIKNPDMVWRDGRYEDNNRGDQSMMLPLDGKVHLVEPCATYGGTTQLKVLHTETDKDKAARWSCDRREDPKPQRKWLCTVEEYVSDTDRRPKGEYISCATYKKVVQNIMEVCREASEEDNARQFREDFRHAEPSWFDGSIDIGYRMEWRPNGGWNVLDVSMVHALYGK